MTYERLSLNDAPLFSSYAESIQRYEFALGYCEGKHVLDAGCGTGYGSQFLAVNGARSVLGIDISTEAITEVRKFYQLDNLYYEARNIEFLGDLHDQWLTHAGVLRQKRARELFEQLCEAYYNPMSRIGRAIKKITGKGPWGHLRLQGPRTRLLVTM